MKCVALAVAALVLVGGEAAGSKAAAEADARAWLRSRGGQPNTDELAELRTENPSAYALVKALLVKQQLGLLDPRHPNKAMTAAAAPPAVSDEDKASLAKMEAEVKARPAPEQAAPDADAVYPEASAAPAKHDWFNWKPTDSASSDDQMVSSVLGEVAALKGGAAPSLVTKHAEASAATVSAGEGITTSASVSAGEGVTASASVGGEESVAARSSSASAGTSKHDWFNWKPTDSATSDDKMIASVSADEKPAAGSISTSRNLLASNAGSSALASEGAALGFDTGDAPPAPMAHQQSAAADVAADAPPTPVARQQSAPADAAAVPPAAPKKKNAFWGSLFDNVDRDIKPAAARPPPSAASQGSEPQPVAAAPQQVVAAPQQAAPENSYLSEYGLGSASLAAQPRRQPNHPNPYLEMSGMSSSAPQSSLISSRAKVQPATEATASSNPYLKNLDLFG